MSKKSHRHVHVSEWNNMWSGEEEEEKHVQTRELAKAAEAHLPRKLQNAPSPSTRWRLPAELRELLGSNWIAFFLFLFQPRSSHPPFLSRRIFIA